VTQPNPTRSEITNRPKLYAYRVFLFVSDLGLRFYNKMLSYRRDPAAGCVSFGQK